MDWLQTVLNSWTDVLEPVLHASCDEEALCNWHSAQYDLRQKMRFHTERIQGNSILFDNEGVYYLAVGRYGDIADVLEKACVALSSGPQTTAKMKILFSFWQVCIVLSTTYSARLPEKYTGWSDRVKEAVSVDVTALFLPVQCVSFSLRLIVYALSPVGLIALLLLLGEGGGR